MRCYHRFETVCVHANGDVVAGAGVERVDFYNYGEPFLYRPLADALRHIRGVMPSTTIAISTDGMLVRSPVEDAIVGERLLDWLIFSIDAETRFPYWN